MTRATPPMAIFTGHCGNLRRWWSTSVECCAAWFGPAMFLLITFVGFFFFFLAHESFDFRLVISCECCKFQTTIEERTWGWQKTKIGSERYGENVSLKISVWTSGSHPFNWRFLPEISSRIVPMVEKGAQSCLQCQHIWHIVGRHYFLLNNY